MNVTDGLKVLAKEHANTPAIITEAGELSFSELDKIVSYAAASMHEYGLAPGDIAGIQVVDPVAHIISSLALARLGVGQFVFHRADPPQLKKALRDHINITVAISDTALPSGIDCIEPVPGNLNELKHLDNRSFDPVDATDLPMFIQRSSGTTGFPKLSMVSHSKALYRFADLGIYTDRNRLLSIAAVEFEGAKHNIYRCLLAGGSAVLIRIGKIRMQSLLNTISRLKVNSLSLAPVHASKLIQSAPANTLLFPDFEHIRTGSTVVPDELRKEIRNRLTPNLYIHYGITEVGIVTMAPPDMVETVSGIVGTPVPGTTIEVVDDNDIPVSSGCTGQVRVKSPGMVSEYINDNETSSSVFRDGWFYTGDLGELTPEGALIHHGRADDIMIFDGINISPLEIENIMLRHPAVAEAAAVPVRGTSHGDLPVVAVVVSEPVEGKDLLKFAQSWLGQRAPVYIEVMSQLPRNTAGKVLKTQLAETVHKHFAASNRRRKSNPTDFNRWQDASTTWGRRFPRRAKIVAAYIPGNCSVLDIGAGSMILQQYLPDNCRYQPCDIHPRTPDCMIADLNAGEFPEGNYDWVVMVGVLQYLRDPRWALEKCLTVARQGIFSYPPMVDEYPYNNVIKWRKSYGWFTHFESEQYYSMVEDAGWHITNHEIIGVNNAPIKDHLVICNAK